jgi:hypothetical protein
LLLLLLLLLLFMHPFRLEEIACQFSFTYYELLGQATPDALDKLAYLYLDHSVSLICWHSDCDDLHCGCCWDVYNCACMWTTHVFYSASVMVFTSAAGPGHT